MKRLDDFISEKAVIRCNIPLFNYGDAFEFINLCTANGKPVVGIDAFYLNGNGIQPSQEHSVDFSSSYNEYDTKDNKAALEFLEVKKDLNMVFEIVYE